MSIKIGRFFFTKYMANDDFSEPPRRTGSKNPIFFFPDFGVWVTSKAWGSDSVRFWGSYQLSPFWGRGVPAGGLYRPSTPAPGNANLASQAKSNPGWNNFRSLLCFPLWVRSTVANYEKQHNFLIIFSLVITLFEVLWCQMGLKHGQKVSCCCCLCIYGKGNEKQTIMHPAAAAFVY